MTRTLLPDIVTAPGHIKRQANGTYPGLRLRGQRSVDG